MRIRDWSSDVCSSDLPAPSPAFLKKSRRPALISSFLLLTADPPFHVVTLDFASGRPETPPLHCYSRSPIRRSPIRRSPIREGPMALSRHVESLGLDRQEEAADGADRHVEHRRLRGLQRSEEHTSELQSLMRISYAVFCLKKNTNHLHPITQTTNHT